MTQASEQNVQSGSTSQGSAHGATAAGGATHAAGVAHVAGAGHAADADHGSGHATDHGAASLGPIDRRMWGAGIVATGIGLVIVACFVVATSGAAAY